MPTFQPRPRASSNPAGIYSIDINNNGILDGDEDHNGNELTNLEEQNKIVAPINAVDKGDTEGVKALLDYDSYVAIVSFGMTPLMSAAREGHTEVVKILLDADADVNVKREDGYTALKASTEEGHYEIIKLLKKAGAKE